jgi:hypothetical protein
MYHHVLSACEGQISTIFGRSGEQSITNAQGIFWRWLCGKTLGEQSQQATQAPPAETAILDEPSCRAAAAKPARLASQAYSKSASSPFNHGQITQDIHLIPSTILQVRQNNQRDTTSCAKQHSYPHIADCDTLQAGVFPLRKESAFCCPISRLRLPISPAYRVTI